MLQRARRKSGRLEVRISPSVYALVQRAANLQGRSISDFVVMAAQQAAGDAIERHDIIALSQAEQERFAAALRKPRRPNAAMKRAKAAHRRLIER